MEVAKSPKKVDLEASPVVDLTAVEELDDVEDLEQESPRKKTRTSAQAGAEAAKGSGGVDTGSVKASNENSAEVSRPTTSRGRGNRVTSSSRGSPLTNTRCPLRETPQKQLQRGRHSCEAVTPEVNFIRSYLLKLPQAMPRQLRWAIGDDLWSVIHSKQTRNRTAGSMARLLRNHPGIKPQMRAILLDWIIEVCEVYNQFRDTYYLAMDLFDSYLLATDNLPKEQLQLVGVACLFIAGKMEEIYPPQINEYSYVSDGACEDRQIIAKELAILTALKWDICPMTANNWLTLFLQLCQVNPAVDAGQPRPEDSAKVDLLKPKICPQDFSVCAQLLDLCTLCMESVSFPSFHLAACVVGHVLGQEQMQRVSSLNPSAVEACFQWMTPFVAILREQSPSKAACSPDFNKQVHNVNLSLLEQAQTLRAQMDLNRQVSTPSAHGGANAAARSRGLTPMKTPTSSRKRGFYEDMTPPSTQKKMRFNDENCR